MVYDVSSPNVLDRNIPSVLSLRAEEVQGEQHYKNDACVSDEHEYVFGANGVYADVRVCEGDEPCVLPRH